MLLIGIATFVIGSCTTAIASVQNRLCEEMPLSIKKNKPKTLFLSIWAIGLGVILMVSGSILGNTFAKNTAMNSTGFGLLLTGICIFVLGISGTALGTLKLKLCDEKKLGTKIEKPRILFLSILSIGIGVVLIVVGSTLGSSYVKESIMNYIGFGMLISGISFLSIGLSGTVVAALKTRLNLYGKYIIEPAPRVILGSIWAIGMGAMLIGDGSLIASSYEKNTIMNYTGFGMLLAGTGVFVYGLFETARLYAMGYLNNKLIHKPQRVTRKLEMKKGPFSGRLKNSMTHLVKTSAILNLACIIAAVCILFFSLWQLDLIVSGPVWWSSSPGGEGTGWSHPDGAYANQYFQCFLWKTTVGQAYDTLFMLIFLSFIVIFAGAFFWPKGQFKDSNIKLKLSGQDNLIKAKRKHVKRSKRNLSTNPTISRTETFLTNLTYEKKLPTDQ